MGAADLLPEAHGEHVSWSRVRLTVGGFATIVPSGAAVDSALGA